MDISGTAELHFIALVLKKQQHINLNLSIKDDVCFAAARRLFPPSSPSLVMSAAYELMSYSPSLSHMCDGFREKASLPPAQLTSSIHLCLAAAQINDAGRVLTRCCNELT